MPALSGCPHCPVFVFFSNMSIADAKTRIPLTPDAQIKKIKTNSHFCTENNDDGFFTHANIFRVMLEMYNDKTVEDNEINIANTMPI